MTNEYVSEPWDLSDVAPDHRSHCFQKRLKDVEDMVSIFEERKPLLKNDITQDDFNRTLHLYEEIAEHLSKIRHYGQLFFSSDTSNAEARSLLTRIIDFNAKMINRILFFDLWWKKELDENNYYRLLKYATHLEYYFIRSRKLAKFTLSEPEEKIINIKDATGIDFIQKLYDQYTEKFIFYMPLDGVKKRLTKPELTAFFQSADPRKRESAYRSLLKVYGRNEDILSELYRSVVMNWKNEGIHLRGYDSSISIRNVSNDIPDDVVETLLSVCRNNRYVFQRYFKDKAKILGMEKMNRYHIYAPKDELADNQIPYHFAVELVITALKTFSERMSSLAQKVLDEKHIDSEVRKGKRSGAFCATAAPHVIPYVLVNYMGKQKDIFTLAHELGHAVHSQLASDKSIFVQQASIPLAELASVFCEIIVFETVYANVSEDEKKSLVIRQLDNMYATIMRQAYFTVFEKKAHEAISNGATGNDISDIYYSNLKEQFENAIEVPELFKYEWTYIPHFFRSPFYTYAYSFGHLLSISLYQTYRKEGKNFGEKYMEILSSGGSKSPEKLLKENEINIRSKEFWESGFDYIKERTKNMERLTLETEMRDT